MTRGDLLKKLATEILGKDVANKIWKRVEFIGDIAVIRTPFDMDPIILRPLAEEIMRKFRFVKSVWAALPGVEGPYRLRKHVWLAGENRSETVYVEHKCLFEVDINKVYISPSLNYEHKRIARLVQQGEVITNMFAGAGLFSIIIAKYARPRKVYSIDINPFAYQYMVKNIALNKVEDIVEPILGDAKEVVETRLSNSSNRVLMPYPELALEYLPYAVKALLNRKGWIHVYLHVKTNRGEHYIDKSIELIDKRLREIGVYEYRVNLVRKVRNVGPRTHQMVIDIELK